MAIAVKGIVKTRDENDEYVIPKITKNRDFLNIENFLLKNIFSSKYITSGKITIPNIKGLRSWTTKKYENKIPAMILDFLPKHKIS